MWTPIVAVILIVTGCLLLILGSVPIENTIEGNTLIVKFMIGQKKIDISGAEFLPVPDDSEQHIIRKLGTSICNKKSGRFMNVKTRNTYYFYLTGKGKKVYFEAGGKKYVIDDVKNYNSVR